MSETAVGLPAALAGWRLYIAIAEWIADVPAPAAVALGIAPGRRPSEAMIRRLLQALDSDLLAAAVSGWLSTRAMATAPAQRRAIVVDGKTLQVSKDFDLTETAVRDWVKQAELELEPAATG